MNEQDCKILGRVYSALLTLGAVSTERLCSVCDFNSRTILWATYQLRARETAAGLWILPDSMLPVSYLDNGRIPA